MRVRAAGAALVLICWQALAMAHTHLVKSEPADASTLAAAPSRFVLQFASPATLTALAVSKDGAPARKIEPLPLDPATEISLPAPPLAPGKYLLTWRVVSGDGHVMSGKLTFTIGGSHP